MCTETLLWEFSPYSVTIIHNSLDDGLCHALLHQNNTVVADAAFTESYEAIAQSNEWMATLVTRAGAKEE